MLIASRNSFMPGSLKNPYVTNGLVAFWDGIWNADLGKHDVKSPVWKDLTNNGWDFPIDNIIFYDNYATITSDVYSNKISYEFFDKWNAGSFDGVWERPNPDAISGAIKSNNGFFWFGRFGIDNIDTSAANAYLWWIN